MAPEFKEMDPVKKMLAIEFSTIYRVLANNPSITFEKTNKDPCYNTLVGKAVVVIRDKNEHIGTLVYAYDFQGGHGKEHEIHKQLKIPESYVNPGSTSTKSILLGWRGISKSDTGERTDSYKDLIPFP